MRLRSPDLGLAPVKSLANATGNKLRPIGSEIEVRRDAQAQVYRGKPNVTKSMFFCVVCQREPQEMGYYGAESSGTQKDDNYIHGYCKCHGKWCEFGCTYGQAWLAIDTGNKIEVFAPEGRIEEGAAVLENKKPAPLALPDRGGPVIDV